LPRSGIKYIGRHIMLKGVYLEKLLSGEKKATIRKGIYKPRYSEVIIHAGGRPVAKARITRIYYKKLRELSEYEARLEGYNSIDELMSELRRVYGDLSGEEYFTIIELEIVQRLDNLPIEDPYCGLSPADIARISLRYLTSDLTELDKKILLDLTRTNSIRKTAANIFSDLNKRRLVRRAVKNALRLLIEKNIITTHRGRRVEESSGE